MIEIKDKSKCSGCTACYSVCPEKCIYMECDYEGFVYPIVDTSRCVDCNKCESVCPYINIETPMMNGEVEVYGCQSLDETYRKISTSGGVFSVIAREIINRGGVVYGAGFDYEFNVIHKKATNCDEIIDMCGSKYVQSTLGDIFFDIRKNLVLGVEVLFVGAPCQVKGLLNLMNGKFSDLLYTIDFKCYGVPSHKIYRLWLDSLVESHGYPISNINFRDKKYGYAGVNCKISFANETILEDKIEVKTFLKTMFSHINLRPSCYQCKFRGSKNCDFTLGDMWDIGSFNKYMDDDKGTTNVQINTTKAKLLFDSIQPYLRVCFIKRYSMFKYNSMCENAIRKIKIPNTRDSFFHDSEKMKYTDLIKKHLPSSIRDYTASVLKPLIIKLPGSSFFFRRLKQKKMRDKKRR